MRTPPFAVLAFSAIVFAAGVSPTLEWVRTTGGSGVNEVVGTAADGHGNLYIVGTTRSLDFPVTAGAAQRAAGGSTLVRINGSTGAAEKIYAPALPNITNLAADPRNPQILYAAAGSMALKSKDAGSTWASLYQFGPRVTLNAFAVDPSNGNVLYAGANGQGLFKSIDGGLTWAAINNGITPERSGQIFAYDLWVDPSSPEVVFARVAAGDNGLFRSANGAGDQAPGPRRLLRVSRFCLRPVRPRHALRHEFRARPHEYGPRPDLRAAGSAP